MKLKQRSNNKRGAILMLMTVMLPFLLIPVAGLAIDATIIHIVQTKLQAAVDAAALGSGRLLGTPANITEIAGEFFSANFTVGARGFWGATLPTSGGANPNITYTTGITKTITVNAHAQVPTLFMRVMGFQAATVSAIGQASRRDARVVFVLDRSGSMDLGSGQPIGLVKQWTQSFIKEFTPGLDEVGVVVFDGTGVVAYPSGTTYTPTPGIVGSPSPGGPDTCFWDTTQASGNSKYGVTGGTTCGNTGQPDAVYQVGQLAVGGGTGMADALSLAYIELQKAHLRDLKANGSDTKTNAILLFTDGVPSAVSLYANDPNNGGPWLTASSGCTYRNNNNGPTQNPIYFWVTAPGNPIYSSMWGGNLQLDSYMVDTTHTPAWYVTHAMPKTTPPPFSSYVETAAPTNPPETGCNNFYATGGWTGYWNNLSRVPATDKWGNSTATGDGNGSRDAYFINTSGTHVVTYDNGTTFTGILNNPSGGSPPGQNAADNANQWGLAMWNATDAAAKNIRTDANYTNRGESSPMQIQILVIGYSGTTGTDAGLLKRIANDPDDTQSPNSLPAAWTSSSQPKGKFCLGTDLLTLQGCVDIMSSILLHLTR